MYGTNLPQFKQSMCVHTRVVFVSHACCCCFCGMGDCLATHMCGYTRVHTPTVLHTCVPTCTQVFTHGCFSLVSDILQSIAICFSVTNTCLGFSEGFPCRIGLQTTQSVEQSIEDLASAKIKEPVMSECYE